ncbi:MAG: YggS family pyridoxal phosphate-dependent enzyme [Spirochaetaceae bacterium]|jgi:pyridoxal phosphate enzyme (YggS family)|nr:YggS family pyridoxal phosphate-dependent enzyme [Spirochaetaceae bacterium]
MAVLENILRIKDEIHEVCLRTGRRPNEIRLMAVSKFQEISLIEEAAKADLRLFGESRVQEAAKKFNTLRRLYPDIELHLIGHLQRNKAKTAAALFDCVESLDSAGIARELGLVIVASPTIPNLTALFELNAGEKTKSGFMDEDALCAGVETALEAGGIKPAGLMTMAPFTSDETAIRKAFRKLVKAQTRLRRAFPECAWDCLSMGMSGDFKIAIEEGSTLIRIGTALFGERCETVG